MPCALNFLTPKTLLIYFIYSPCNSSNCVLLFDYLTSCQEATIFSHSPTKILYVEDFNVNCRDWFGSIQDDPDRVKALSFSLLNDLDQLIKHPAWVPNYHDHSHSSNSPFLFIWILLLKKQYFFPFGIPYNNLTSIPLNWTYPSLSLSKCLFQLSGRAWWSSLPSFYTNFP